VVVLLVAMRFLAATATGTAAMSWNDPAMVKLLARSKQKSSTPN